MNKFFMIFFIINISLFSKDLEIGVILQDNSPSSKNLLKILKSELSQNFQGTKFNPKFIEQIYLGNNSINSSLNILNSNKKIDAIFILTSTSIDKIKNVKMNKFYSVPFGFGKDYNKSYNNLNYIYSNLDLKRIENMFSEINGNKKGEILISNMNKENLDKLQKIIKNKGLNLDILPASKELLIKALNEKIPTFLIDFNQNLNKYSYFGLNLKREISKRLRGASLNYLFYKTGKGLGNIIKVSSPYEDIYINSNIVAETGLYPNLIFFQKISKINEKIENKKLLTLKNAVTIALNSNLSLLESKENINTSFYNYKMSSSKRLPQISANMAYSALDKHSPNFHQGTPENAVNSYLELSQVIFNDQLNSNIYNNKLSVDSKKRSYDQLKLNTIYYVASTYINILQLNSQLNIQKNNYELLKDTLDIAKINYKVGAGGLQDVYRLESNVASSLGTISEIKGEIKSQEIYLNMLLNCPKNIDYSYERLSNIESYFALGDGLLNNLVFNPEKAIKIQKFLVEESLKNSNGIKEIENSIKGKEREYKTSKRERFTPELNAFGRYNKNNLITPWGENSNMNTPSEYWEAGVSFKIPLVQGGEIINNENRIKSQLNSLNYNEMLAKSQLEKEILQEYSEISTNFTKVYTSKISVSASKKNLNIVKNLYAEGTINITDFLSAQNNTLSQELNYTIEQFDLINSLLKMENLFGKSSLTMSKSEKVQLIEKLQNQLSN